MDRIHVVIWNELTDETVYDSAPDEFEFSTPIMTIEGGSVVIQKEKQPES